MDAKPDALESAKNARNGQENAFGAVCKHAPMGAFFGRDFDHMGFLAFVGPRFKHGEAKGKGKAQE